MALTERVPPSAAAALERLVPHHSPTRPRALAVLDGVLSGRVWTDDPMRPRAVLVMEDADGTVYVGGTLSRDAVRQALTGVETASGELIFGFSRADDPLRALVPAEPFWSGEAVDFTERRPPADEAELVAAPLPDGARVVRLDAELLPRIEWYEDTIRAFGSAQRWEQLAVGFAVMIGDEMVAESLAGPRTRATLEMGVATREAHRRRGYGTLVSQLVARACEARGDAVWWNANATNQPSVAIARRLGFQRERRYELVACRAPVGGSVGSA